MIKDKIIKRAGSALAGAALVVGGVAVPAAPAQAADDSYWLTNSDSNSSAFDCYAYLDGAWRKINDGSTKKGMTATTPFKCDHNWYAMSITGSVVTGTLKANTAYRWTSSSMARLGDFKWAVAFQA